jgi:hypothetical protein
VFRKLQGRTVVVNTNTGEAFRGTVLAVTGSVIRLTNVQVVEATGRAGEAEGIVRISRRIVTWIQEL